MDDKIQMIKSNFNKIKEIRIQVMNCFNALEIKLSKLKFTTNDFIKNNKNNKNNIFVFGLDSFQFQGKIIDYEYNYMKQFYLTLNNRMYCEYYKLYKLILNYTEEIIGTNKNIETLKNTNIFPVYKDLEPLKQYDIETIDEIHKMITTLLYNLNDHIFAKETQLQLFKLKQQSGLNINNFVNTFDFDVIVIKQKCFLYLSYLDFFHNIHTKHFKRFSKKMKLMNDYLDEDIKFDEDMYRDDDSIKSPASTNSLDSYEDHFTLPNKNLTERSLKISKPNNITLSIDEINNTGLHNINSMLDTLTNSFDNVSDHIINTQLEDEVDEIVNEIVEVVEEVDEIVNEIVEVVEEEVDEIVEVEVEVEVDEIVNEIVNEIVDVEEVVEEELEDELEDELEIDVEKIEKKKRKRNKKKK